MRAKKFKVLDKELTITEARILILDLYCNSRQEIATVLGCKHNTVRTHIRTIHDKYGLHGQRELLRFAIDNGFYNAGYLQGEYLFENLENLPWQSAVAC